MQAVIMAGGKGTRLTSITKNLIPKPMVDVLGRPLLEWQIDILKRYGIDDICFIIGHLGERIQEYFGNGSAFGIHITYIVETEPLGTAGSLFFLKEWLKESEFFLVFGDVFFEVDLNRMMKFHKKKKSDVTLFVHPNSHPYDSDIVNMDMDDKIMSFYFKQQKRDYWYKNLVNAGLYIINKSVCEKLAEPLKMDLEKELFTKIIKDNGSVYGYHSPEYIKDIGTEERLSANIADIQSGYIEAKCLEKKQKCIFFDRDGTLNILKGLLYREEDFELEKNVIEAIRLVNNSEWLCIVITNQPAVARGLCQIKDVDLIHKKLETLLGNEGTYLDDIVYCPHHPDKGYPEENPLFKIECSCRKPNTGMLKECEERYNIDLEQSWIIGDTTSDIKTGENARMHTALVKTGEAGSDGKYSVQSEIVGENIEEIVRQIIGRK